MWSKVQEWIYWFSIGVMQNSQGLYVPEYQHTLYEESAIIGVLSDIHADMLALDTAIETLKARNVNILILNGDLTDYGKVDKLEEVLKRLSEELPLNQERIFITTGNMEDHFLRKSQFIPTMKKYGIILTSQSNNFGYLDINDTRFMVSHLAHRKLPQDISGSRETADFRAGTLGRMDVQIAEQKNISTVGVRFALVADSHFPFLWKDPKTDTIFINSGTITDRKNFSLPRSVAIIDLVQEQAEILDIEASPQKGQIYESMCLRAML
jgi:predicted phosphodiesterase